MTGLKGLKYEYRDTKDFLSRMFGVRGIPTLVLLDREGNLLTKDGRKAVMEVPFDKLESYEAEKKAKEERMDEVGMNQLPETVTYSCHAHTMKKIKNPYGNMGMSCDVCEGTIGKFYIYIKIIIILSEFK